MKLWRGLVELMAVTNDKGVDDVLSTASGKILQEPWFCLAEFGIFADVSKTNIHDRSLLDMEILNENTMFAVMDLSLVQNTGPELFR